MILGLSNAGCSRNSHRVVSSPNYGLEVLTMTDYPDVFEPNLRLRALGVSMALIAIVVVILDSIL